MSDRDQTAYTADLGEELDNDLSAEDLSEDEWSDSMDGEVVHYADEDYAAVGGDSQVPTYENDLEATPPPSQERRETFAPPLALGMLFFLATIAAAVGIGYGVMLALGGHPSQLLDFDGLRNFDRLFAFGEHPVNLFWLLAIAVMVLGLLVSGAVARVVRKVRQQAEWRQALLDRLTALTLESEEAWHAEELQDDPAVAAFAANILHEWRVVQGKLTRSISQDAELRRLEKALIDNTRVDMTSGFESPAVSSLADEVLRQFDDRLSAEQEGQALLARLADDGGDQVAILNEACSWNSATLDQISVQGAAIERLGVKAKKMSEAARNLGDSLSGEDRRAALTRMQEELASIPLGSGNDGTGAPNAGLRDVADRAGKLTFKITMEVARLGAKGEHLLPLTQALEELTNSFRDLADGGTGNGGAGQNELAAALGRVRQRLATLQESEELVGEPLEAWNQLVDSAGEIPPLARQISEQLVALARDFNQQTDRLVDLGRRYGELTGVPFDSQAPASGQASTPPAGGLDVEQHDPFGSRNVTVEPTPQVADPFAGASNSPFGDDVTTGATNPNGSIMEPELPPIAQTDPSKASDGPPEPGAIDLDSGPESKPEAATTAAPEVALSSDEDRIYDLAEFGAVPLTEEAGTATATEDRIYDLEEFGAVAIG